MLKGVLIHTREARGKKAHAYVDLLQCPHDSYLTMIILLDVIENPCKGEGHISDILYLQLDNCFTENKTKYIFSLCTILVELKIFNKVIVRHLVIYLLAYAYIYSVPSMSVHIVKDQLPTCWTHP